MNDIVLVQEAGPRCSWPLARITGVHYGRDGLVRSCTVKFNNSFYRRPISKLVLLEASNKQPEQVTQDGATITGPYDITGERSFCLHPGVTGRNCQDGEQQGPVACQVKEAKTRLTTRTTFCTPPVTTDRGTSATPTPGKKTRVIQRKVANPWHMYKCCMFLAQVHKQVLTREQTAYMHTLT